MLRHSDTTDAGPRPLIVVTLEPVSVDWFHRVLTAASQQFGDHQAPRPGLRLIRVDRNKARLPKLRRRHRRRADRVVIVGELGAWLWHLAGCDVLYLRPGLLHLKELFAGIGQDDGAARRIAGLLAADRLLSNWPTLSLETLFHSPDETAAFLETRFALNVPPAAFPDPGGAYRKALIETLRIVEPGRRHYKSGMVSFSPGHAYAATVEGAGSLALGEGWSWPEAEHTWSDGHRVALVIPLADVGRTRLRVRLDGMLAPGQMVVRVSVGGQVVLVVDKKEVPSRDHAMTFSLPCPAGEEPVLSIELEISSTFCPKDAGLSEDDRQLGFALRSFTITEDTLLPASLRSLIGWRRPAVTLALSAPPPGSGVNLGAVLPESGLSGSLILLSQAAANRRGWLGSGGRGGGFPRAAADRLCSVGFAGTLPELITELGRHDAFLDLVVLAAADLLGEVFEALEPVVAKRPRAMPDIAVCTEDAGFFERSFWQFRDRYETVMHRLAMAAAYPELVSFIARPG